MSEYPIYPIIQQSFFEYKSINEIDRQIELISELELFISHILSDKECDEIKEDLRALRRLRSNLNKAKKIIDEHD